MLYGFRRSPLRVAAFSAAAAAFSAVVLLAPASALAQKTIKFIAEVDLKSLDPIWTTAYITRNHGYMVYDTLFATDAKFQVHPQMVDKYETSKDGLTWTFTVRDGLKFHDGAPVSPADCIASIERWAKRDVLGQKLGEMTESWTVVNDKTFRLKKKRIILAGDVPSPITPPPGCRFHTRCPYAEERCRKEEPLMKQVQPGHHVACHLR